MLMNWLGNWIFDHKKSSIDKAFDAAICSHLSNTHMIPSYWIVGEIPHRKHSSFVRMYHNMFCFAQYSKLGTAEQQETIIDPWGG